MPAKSSAVAIYVIAFLGVLVSIYALSYYTGAQNFLPAKGSLVKELYWNIAFYIHITSGAIALGVGWIQFIKKFRIKNIRRHRIIGKVYVAGIIFFASPSGMVLAFNANEGLAAQLGFGCLAFIWFYVTLKAWLAIKTGNVVHHRAWITRSYALTMAAITLRVWLPLAMAFNLSMHQAYPAISWFCWVPNLLVTEWLILPHTIKHAKAVKPAPAVL
ncbi:MAG TPA: DUF2306 domain-containing protein [Chitinophagaceae bacterium]|nr:DUF2306 domain-containing protein [Chitinophagaceae bacterium]